MMRPRRYSLVRNDGRIWIDGPIAADAVSAASVRRSFQEVEPDGPVRVVVETAGGRCDEGLAIYIALRECGRPIEMTVLRAASVGALIAMAGDSIAIGERGSFFLHPPGYDRDHVASFAMHMTADTFRHAAQRLDRTDAVSLDIFARRTGRDRSEIARLQAAETTLDAHRAVALGFADSIIPNAGADHG